MQARLNKIMTTRRYHIKYNFVASLTRHKPLKLLDMFCWLSSFLIFSLSIHFFYITMYTILITLQINKTKRNTTEDTTKTPQCPCFCFLWKQGILNTDCKNKIKNKNKKVNEKRKPKIQWNPRLPWEKRVSRMIRHYREKNN